MHLMTSVCSCEYFVKVQAGQYVPGKIENVSHTMKFTIDYQKLMIYNEMAHSLS